MTVTVVEAEEDPAPFVTVSVKFNTVVAATRGAVKLGVAVLAPVRATCGTSVAAWTQEKVKGAVPVEALPLSDTAAPEATVCAAPALATGAAVEPGQPASDGAAAPGQGLSCPTRVPAEEV